MEPTNLIWTEKYRPASLDALVLENSTREFLTNFIKEGSIPHLLLSGNVGCGKTTIAKILLKTLNCDSIVLNASDERGIDTVRNKVKLFSMMSSFKDLKIVFLDEAESMTIDAQYSLRNMMETYSEHTRFILTCNYLNKIIEPIRSRCQLIEFKNLGRKQIISVLSGILKNENIKYDTDDLLVLIDTYYPDMRSMINFCQLNSKNGSLKLKNVDSFRNFESILEYIRKKDLAKIRELDLEFVECYRYLFDKVTELTDDYKKKVEISLVIAEYMWREAFIPDKSINFAACCLSIMNLL